MDGTAASISTSKRSQPAPVTLLTTLGGLSIASALEALLAKDDVISPGFFKHLLLSHDIDIPSDGIVSLAKAWNVSSIDRLLTNDDDDDDGSLPLSGPYFLSHDSLALHQAWRLYDDTAATLVCPVVPSPDQGERT